MLQQRDLIGPTEAATIARLKRSPDGRSLLLPPAPVVDDGVMRLLAAGFALAGPGKLIVPYVPLG